MAIPLIRIKYSWLRRTLRTFLFCFVLLNTMAAFHAWKLTHNYPGAATHVKGPDKMNFFEKTGALIFGVKNSKPVISEYPSLPYETINLYTKDSLKIECWKIHKDPAKGTVLLFHGHLGTKADMLAEAEVFNDMGYQTLLADFRAHGNSDGITCSIGRNEGEEVKLAYDYIRLWGEKNIILYGVSLGAVAITRSLYAYEGVKPESLVLEMPFGSLQKTVQGRFKMMGLPKEPASAVLTFWGGIEQGFWAFSHKPERYAKKINCPTLLQWGELDKRVTRKEMETIYNNLNTSKKQLEIYSDAGHEALLNKDSIRWRNTIERFLDN
jgi:alpha-beta hydrolase superfamily lysophospholipase